MKLEATVNKRQNPALHVRVASPLPTHRAEATATRASLDSILKREQQHAQSVLVISTVTLPPVLHVRNALQVESVTLALWRRVLASTLYLILPSRLES